MNNPAILQFTEQELEEQGISVKLALKITFQAQVYKRIRNLPKIHYETALKQCQDYADSNRLSLLVESPLYFSVWVHEPDTTAQASNDSHANHTPVIEYSGDEEPTPKYQSTASAPRPRNVEILRNDRGVAYIDDDTVVPTQSNVDKTTHQTTQSAPPKKVFRKYRGVTYEVEVSDTPQISKPPKKYRGQSY